MKKRIVSMLLAIVMVVGLVPGMALTANAAYTGSPVLKSAIASQETPDDVTLTYEFQSSSWYPTAGTTYKLYADTNKTTEAGSVVLTDGTTPTLEVTLNEAPVRDTRYYLTATAPNSDESKFTSVVVKTYRITNGFAFSYGEYSDIGFVDFFQDQMTYDIVLPPATAKDAAISVEFETANGATVTYSGDTALSNGSGSITAAVVSETPVLSYTYTINFTTMNLDGQGTETEPYLITSSAELKQLADCLNNCGAAPMDTDSCGYGNFCGYYFRLTKDIDLDGIEWEPIGHSGSTYFAGHFDGDDHTISNMTTTGRTAPGEDGTDCSRFNAAGLFGWCAFGSVKNVTVDNADVTAIGQNEMGYAGGLIAVPFGCSVINCHVKNSTIESGRVPITNSNFAGGVAGMAAAATFEECSSVNNTVRGTMYVGGFIGSQEGESNYTDCYVADTTIESVMVSSSFNCNVGGFASASQDGDYVMTNCFVYDCKTQVADGANTNQYEEGVLNKYEWSSDIALTTNCYYYTTQTYEDGTAATAVAKTTEEFADGTVLAALNGDRTGEDVVWMQGEDYPVFKVPTYTVTATANPTAGGTVTGGGEYEEGTTVTLTATANEGYTFVNWAENGSADTAITGNAFAMPAADVVVTAVFKPISYSIGYTMNGGNASNPATYTIETETFTLTNPTKVGYTFKSWSGTGLTGDENQTVTIAKGSTGDRAYTANWTANTYTVKFDANGGIGTMADQNFTYDAAQNLTANAFTYANKHFNGWKDSGGNSYSNSQSVSNLTPEANGTVTLYAQWSDKPAQEITFDTTDRSATYGDGTLEARNATATGTVTYSSSNPDVATVDTNGVVTVLKAGEVTITASAAETDDYAAGSASYKLTISKKKLTITVANKSVYVGSQKPELSTAASGTDYTISGLVGSDTVTVTLSYATEPDMTKAGEYAITATGTDVSGNYTFDVVDGKLTVSYRPSSGGSSNTTSKTEKNEDGSTTTTTTNKTTGTVTETTKYPDGSTTTVETKKDGSATETSKNSDGTTGTVVTDKDGNVTEVSAKVPAAAVKAATESGEAVKLPVEVEVADDADKAVEIEVDVPTGGAKVDIPVEDVTSGTVVVVVNKDGTEEIVKKSTVTEDGVVVALDEDATLKIVDNSKHFVDVHPVDHWAETAVDFVVARTIYSGTSATTFHPDNPMTRGMLAVVLHNMEDNPDHAFDDVFCDVAEGSWYEDAIHWAADSGIVSGYGNGLYGPNDNITREQLAVMLWRYAGSPDSDQSLAHFKDAHLIASYAETALAWANENGIINGKGDGILDPKGNATRAQVAQMLMNYLQK